MEGRRTIKSIRLSNFLSFGPDSPEIALEPLNILIGANGSGKSNFLAAFDVLKATTRDIEAPFRQGGGFQAWVNSQREADGKIRFDSELCLAPASQRIHLDDDWVRHELTLLGGPSRVIVTGERIHGTSEDLEGEPIHRVVYDRDDEEMRKSPRHLRNKAVLSWLSDPLAHPELFKLKELYSNIRVYRDWTFGNESRVRQRQRLDLPQDFVLEDFSNLFLVFNDLRTKSGAWATVRERVRAPYESVHELITKVEGGAIGLYLEEVDGRIFSADRLSEGTLRYLALVAILCHPTPLPLVIIEEPELGLHPDLIRSVGEMLIEASARTQLIVTTHSAELVDAVQAHPESVLVFERGDRGTTCRRLEPGKVESWLERYSLGELWKSGEIGGNRW